MATAEQLAFSISTEGRGIHVLLWDDQADLARTLVALRAALPDLTMRAVLVSEEDLPTLRQLVESRTPLAADPSGAATSSDAIGSYFWILFLPQATAGAIGPWLNGWRRPISEAPGALLVMRHADYGAFQRAAPDIASFVGARICDASTTLSVFSPATFQRLEPRLPEHVLAILRRLPGVCPGESEIRDWIEAHAPENRGEVSIP
jgi:hypothetical protein